MGRCCFREENLKEKIIGTDECSSYEKKIQNLTDKQILELEKKLDDKEKERMKI